MAIYNSALVSIGYILSYDKKHVLLLHHNSDAADISYGKHNGYSDFVRLTETPYETFMRTAKEQAGIVINKAVFRGSVMWPDFYDEGKAFFSHIFVSHDHSGEPSLYNGIGQNRWWSVEELLRGDVPIWDGDRYFLPLVFDDNPEPFHGYMPYENGTPKNWSHFRG